MDCVRVVYPDMNGTDVVLAAGSRDHIIYLWKRRVREEMVRSMREYISTELVGHRVRETRRGILRACNELTSVHCL